MLTLIPHAVLLVDDTPDPNDVVAGWSGFAVFIGLILAVVVLLWSFTRQLKKTDRAAEQGVFGPVDTDASDGAEGSEGAADATDEKPMESNGSRRDEG